MIKSKNSKCFTPDTLKDAGCPGYILRQSRIPIKQLLEIGYEKKDIFTALEMIKEYEKSVDDLYSMGYTIAQILNEGIQVETKFSCTKTLQGHTDYVISIILLNDGISLASGSNDNTIKIWQQQLL